MKNGDQKEALETLRIYASIRGPCLGLAARSLLLAPPVPLVSPGRQATMIC